MRKYSQEKVTRVETKEIELKCDLCDNRNWERDLPNVCETTIEYRNGQTFPDAGCVDKISFDICPKCFKDKLIPWLESQGAKRTDSQEEW